MEQWRKSTWALLVWAVLMLAWGVSVALSNGCPDGDSEADRTACEGGNAIAIGAVLGVAAVGFLVLGIIWLASHSRATEPPSDDT